MQISLRRYSLAVALLGLTLLIAACGDSDDPPQQTAVAIETATVTAVPTLEAPTEEPTPVITATATATPTEVAAAVPVVPAGPPDSGSWIDVNVSNHTVSLMDGTTAINVIGPVGVGEQINTGAYLSTQTGLYYVYSMDSALTYDAPYDTYISHWVGFDPALANGFHSFLKDEAGNVVDASTGRVSNGCIRTGAAEAIYAFADIGMPVYVHF